MTDLFTDELLAAMRLPGCCVCRVITADERRWMEARQSSTCGSSSVCRGAIHSKVLFVRSSPICSSRLTSCDQKR